MRDALLKKNRGQVAVSVEFDLDVMEPFRLRKRVCFLYLIMSGTHYIYDGSLSLQSSILPRAREMKN